jgi:hypothetical protein
MTVFRVLLAALIVVVMSTAGTANAAASGDPCPLTSKSRQWSSACFDTAMTGRQIKHPYRRKIVFDRSGFAVIVIASPLEMVVVNRRATIVPLKRAHLTNFDFEPGDNGEIVRFDYKWKYAKKTGQFKCGYYRAGHFQILVPPVYDECDAFAKGSARVCIGCADHCPGGDCHENNWAGGEGLVINEQNEVLRKFALPLIPLCSADKAKPGGEKSLSDFLCLPGS